MHDRELRICVVGAGPRGLSTVERICANARDWPDQAVLIHVVDPFVGQGGEVWRIGQSHLLLMNTIASQVSMFTDSTVDCRGPVRPGPSLHEWARDLARLDPHHPPHICTEAARLGPDDYPTRALYGHYLRWFLRHLVATAPDTVRIRTHATHVVALDDGPEGRQRITLVGGGRLDRLDAVVLAQGHLPVRPGREEQRLLRHSRRTGSAYQPPASPAQVTLDDVRPGERVGLRGLGLNFFDYLILLTEGRGGRFVPANGRTGLTYRPSGAEPVLYGGSRRGVPYHARGENQKGAFGRHQPLFLTEPVIKAFRARARAGQPPEFRREVWPLISREVRAVYYRTLVAANRGPDAAAEFLALFAALPADAEGAERRLSGRFGVPRGDWWSWDRVARPHGERRFTDPGQFRGWLLNHLRADLAEALRGNVDSALKAALDALRDLRNEVRLVVDHRGITGRSYREELQRWYTPLNAFVSIGPPARRIAEAIALIEAGVLHLVGPETRVTAAPDGRGFVISSPVVAGSEVRTDRLIEARLPEFDLRRTTDPLLRHLWRTGQCRSYTIPTPGGDAYPTSGLSVTERPYHLVDAAGRGHERRFAFGVPTESVHWVTAAGIRPGVNSVILADTDAIARACLAISGQPHRLPVRRSGRQPLYAQRYLPLAWLPTTRARAAARPLTRSGNAR